MTSKNDGGEEKKTKLEIKGTHTSSLTVAQTDAPKFWVARHHHDCATLADAALADRATRFSVVVVENYMPSVEKVLLLYTESDLVRAAARYLLHSVVVAFTARHPGKVF